MRLPIAAKFAGMLVVLVVALFAVGFAGLRGLATLNSHANRLYGDHIVTLQKTTALAADTARARNVALEVIASGSPSDVDQLEQELGVKVVPQVTADIDALRLAHAGDPSTERAKIEQIAGLWDRFLSLRTRGPLDQLFGGRSAAHNGAVADRVRAIFDPLEAQTVKQTTAETTQAGSLAQQATMSYRHSRELVILIGALATLLGAIVLSLLIRAVVPRVRRYSNFASSVAAGKADSAVRVSGNDELSDLGVALNEMVKRRITEQSREDAQSEFAEVMQLTESEDEAHDLLKRQIERLIPSSSVVVLNRNNSADRLQATTSVPEDSLLSGALENPKPRSCLAVRFARTHVERRDGDLLVTCEVCGGTADYSTCEPLLVGGEVIGSVLANHSRPMSDDEAQSIKQAVTQAAPVLANLRNLAIAERRAETDSLTGLPNNRNVADTVKRMVAQASRNLSPMAALALDLDHFKQINDTYGHASGDEVLAAVGSTLTMSVRESDFVGRAGGEEFLMLLPDTGLEAARLVAEKVRLAIAELSIPSVQRAITTSIGIAVMPDHAGDATTLLRYADRALYTAKKNGRNRTEEFSRDMLSDGAAIAQPSSPLAEPSPQRHRDLDVPTASG
ncbi:MAG TPA: diguanylate cyclase [Solirubrobacteraceae bacterium]|jgi:diguanylate cyclase (GGDEF)-like protein|nr:diguanylate cyclase [Solirubrobacteraceae bacterium]